MKFHKTKCDVLHMDQVRLDNHLYQYGLGDEWMERSPTEKDFEILVGEKLDMSQQWDLPAQKANYIPSA